MRRTHTIFIYDANDDVASGLEQQIVRWSDGGLLHKFGLLDAQSVALDGRVDALPHTVHQHGEQIHIDVLDWLARNYFDLTRVVVLNTSAHADAVSRLKQVALFCCEEISARQGPDQSIVEISCYVAAPGDSPFHAHDVSQVFHNVVIDPVDQAMPGSSATPVLSRSESGVSERFAAVAGQTIVTIAGLWVFQKEGVLDEVSTGSSQAGLRVARSFVRSLDTPDPLPDLVDRVLEPEFIETTNGWPVPRNTGSHVPALPPVAFADYTLTKLVDAHKSDLELAPMPAPVSVDVQKVTLGTAIRMFVSYLVGGLKSAPRLLLHQLSNSASRVATTTFFGRGSAFEVVVGLRQPTKLTDVDDIEKVASGALRELDPSNHFMPQSYGQLWTDYAGVATGLIDGSVFPAGVDAPRIGDAQAVIQEPKFVVADCVARPYVVSAAALDDSMGQAITVTPGDPHAYLVAKRRLEAAIKASKESQTKREPSGLPSEADEPDFESVPTSQPSESSISQSTLQDLEEWVAQHQDSLSWKFGTTIGSRLETAEQNFAQALAALEIGPPETPSDDLDGRKTIIGALLSGFTIGLGVWAWSYFFKNAGRAGFIAMIVCVVVGMLIGFWRFTRSLRRQFQAVHRYNTRIEEYNRALQVYALYAKEVVRLSSLYWQYQQWTKLLSGLVHRPFGSPVEIPDSGIPILIESEALGTRSAVANLHQGGLDAKVRRLRNSVYTVGWLQRAWSEVENDLLHQFQVQQALPDFPDAWQDTLRRQSGALEYLTEAVQKNGHGAIGRGIRIRELREIVSSFSLENLVTRVELAGGIDYPDAMAPPNSDPGDGLFGELFDPDGAPAARFHHELWRGKGLDASALVADVMIQTTPYLAQDPQRDDSPESMIRQNGYRVNIASTEPMIHEGRTLYGSSRVDFSSVCLPKDLVIFEERDEQPIATWYEAIDDEGD